MRLLIYSVTFVVVYCAFHYITKRWFPILHTFEYFYLVEPVLSVFVCRELENIFYDFDPTHNGNVKLKFKK